MPLGMDKIVTQRIECQTQHAAGSRDHFSEIASVTFCVIANISSQMFGTSLTF